MNRHQRRKAKRARPKCSSCGDRNKPQGTSPIDGKVRCITCHEMHLQPSTEAKDEMTDMRHLKTQLLQEEMHKAILKTFPDKRFEDIGTIVHALGLTAATFAVQGQASEQAFVNAMRTYIRQVQEALGVETASDDDDKPRIILPS